MEEKELLSRIELLEKRVASLEKELSLVAQINQSEKAKEYIASAEKATKIAMLLDISSQEENGLEDNPEKGASGRISSTLSNTSYMNKVTEAREYVKKTDRKVAKAIKEHEKIIDQYDWDLLFEYTEQDGNITIGNYIGFDDIETIVIPDRINGLTVTEIGDRAFENCKNLKEVILPKCIFSIGRNAFRGSGLRKISLPEGLRQMGEYAFAFTQLENIHIPPKLSEIPRGAFYYTQLSSVTFSEGISVIEEQSFAWCKKLKRLDIPKSVKSIRREAFVGVEQIRIPNSVKDMYGMDTSDYVHNLFGDAERERVTVFCHAGSTAMKYAREYRIPIKRYEEFDVLEG